MFDPKQQFFPTPKNVAKKMWAKAKELVPSPDNVFDPNGGKGDLLDAVKDDRKYIGFYTVEIDVDLQSILREKEYQVLGADFLEFDDPFMFDIVMMNPPFHAGEHHVLKAWNMVEPRGCLIALVNAETLNNPTKEGQRLKGLIEQYGGSEDLGPCFSVAERKTNVNVTMLWLEKPRWVIDPNQFQFAGTFKRASDEDYQAFTKNPLNRTDVVDSLIAQYQVCLNMLKVRYQVQTELDYHLTSIPRRSREHDGYEGEDQRKYLFHSHDQFKEVQALKSRFWWALLKLSEMQKIGTSDFRDKFNKFVQERINMAFDRHNILETLAMFCQSIEQIRIDSTCSVFDRATAFHESNKIHPEGWKSNSGWKLNPKIVIPYGIEWDYWGWGLSWHSKKRTFFNDLDEVISWIADTPLDQTSGLASIVERNRKTIQPGAWCETRFYDFKLYKKGTIHLKFKDLYLLDDLNAIVAKERNWLGGDGF